MAILPITAYAQLESVRYTVNTGEMTLSFNTPYDLTSVKFDHIQITDGIHNVVVTADNFAGGQADKLHLDMDRITTTIVNNMNNPSLVLNEGALKFGSIKNAAQSVPIVGIVQVGAIIPDGHEDIQHVMELSVDHFNQILERQDASWRLDIVKQDGKNVILSLLELQQANIHVVIGHESLLEKNEIANLGMTVVACCAESTDYDIIYGDQLSFAMIPDDDDALEAALALMGKMGVNRVLPVYPADDHQIHEHIKYMSQIAVADGIPYKPHHDGEEIAELLANNVLSNLVSVPDIRQGILLTETKDAPRILEAASKDGSLTFAMWFGLGPHNDILNNTDAAAFAQDVDYSVPYAGGLENPFIVSLDSYMYDTLNYTPDKTAYGAYDAVQIVGLSVLGNADIHMSAIDTFASLNFRSDDVASVIPEISSEFGGYTAYVGMDEIGRLEAPVYQMLTVRGGEWVQIGTYNNPRHTLDGTISFGDSILPYTRYTAGDPIIHDVIQVGLMVHEFDEHEASFAARMGLALLDDEYSLLVESVANNNITYSMEVFDEAGIQIVLAHAPELSTFLASKYAQNHDMLVIGTASTSKIVAVPNDALFRMLPSDVWQAKALTGVMRQDNIWGVVAIYPDTPETQLLLDDIDAGFAGEIDMTNSYNSTLDIVTRNVTASIQDMAKKYGIASTAVLVMGGDDTADIINIVSDITHQVNWYGSLGIAGSQSILDETTATINLAALSPAISGGGHAQMILDSLHGTQLPVQTVSLFEAARVAGATIKESESIINIARTLLPLIANDTNLLYDHIAFDSNDDLASGTYDIWRLDDDNNAWVSDSAYSDIVGYISKVPIGVIVPLTGPDAQRGIQQMWGAHLAISAQNEILEEDGVQWRLSQKVIDAATSTDAAQTLYNSNIQAALGPPDTMSVNAIGEFGANNDLVVLSCCADGLDTDNTSTASLGTTPIHKLLVILRMLDDDNISNLLIIHSDNAILRSLVTDFADTSKIQEYTAKDTYSQIAIDAESALSDILTKHDRSSVGVLLLTDHNDDVASILEASFHHNNLPYVNWYGFSIDGALPYILSNHGALDMAASTNFVVATPAIPVGFDELKTELYTTIGFTPSSDAYLMYDAATLLSTTIRGLSGNSAAAGVIGAIPIFAQDLVGTTGLLALNGDNQRTHMSHDTWGIIDGKWVLLGTIPQ